MALYQYNDDHKFEAETEEGHLFDEIRSLVAPITERWSQEKLLERAKQIEEKAKRIQQLILGEVERNL